MKYLKLSSLLVLSLLLFAPAAWADIECRLQPNLRSIRAESMAELIDDVTVRCAWDDGTNGTFADITVEAEADGTQFVGSTFTLVLRLSALPTNGKDNPIMLALPGDNPATIAVEDDDATTETGPYLVDGEINGPNIRWDVVAVPDHSSWDLDSGDSGTFEITGIMVDASGSDESSVTAVIDMSAEGLEDNAILNVPSEKVTIAGVDQALTMELGADAEVAKINSCVPAKFSVVVDLGEGFRTAWTDIDNIEFMASSGTVWGPATAGVLTRIGQGAMLTYVVDETNLRDSTSIEITIDEIDPGDVGDDLTLSVMFVPTRSSSAEFMESATITVGMYVACEGDSLLFPFISNTSGFDTGIVLVNTSEQTGDCGLMWDGEEVEDLKRVPAMGHTAFILSMENADFQGYLKVMCEFTGAHGYAYITDLGGITGAQGYLARRSPNYN